MKITTVPTTPYTDQKPGTSGLRKKVRVFQQKNYLANFIQAIFTCLPNRHGKSLVLGGDGRYFNRDAAQTIVKIAAANGFGELIIGQGGLLSTPAASHIIRKYNALGGIILSASHNPGGKNADFGVKYNTSNGGPATETFTDALFAKTGKINEYQIANCADIDLDRIGKQQVGGMLINIVDPVADYAEMMAGIFDLALIKNSINNQSISLCFDAMHAITGPYASHILQDCLGASGDCVINAVPLEDFGGCHPDPNMAHAKQLTALIFGDNPPTFGAASDGDGDRNMIMGANIFVSPSDSLAIMLANAHLIPAYSDGVNGVARSMPTSQAVDRVAKKMGIECFETPTGWKYFGNLLDAGRITICGEESFGTGSLHIREKDGLWAVLFWLNLLAVKKQSVAEIVHEHWQTFGRDFYCRHDYEAIDLACADDILAHLRQQLPALPGQSFGEYQVSYADEFTYTDPIDNSVSTNQGIRIGFSCGARIVYRLSGTGTAGATLRIYLEKFVADSSLQTAATSEVLADVAKLAQQFSEVKIRTGMTAPTLIT